MSLRYRLFLWVSGLFVAVSVCAYLIENRMTRRELTRAQAALRQEILEGSEERRIDLQNFLTSSILEEMVAIDAILSNISTFSPQALRFGPTSRNEEKGTWGDAVDLLLEYKWVDFIQNTNQGKVTAAIVPQQASMGSTLRIPIDEDLAWGFMGKDPKPYLAVRVPYSLVLQSPIQTGEELIEQMRGVVPCPYLLFDPEQMVAEKPLPLEPGSLSPIPVSWTEGYELDVEPFVKGFQRGRELLLAKKIIPPQMTAEELKERIDGGALVQDSVLNSIPTGLPTLPVSKEQLMKQKIDEVALRYTQINMIWLLIALFDQGLFGEDLFTFPSPSAVTVFSTENSVGVGFHSRDVLFSKSIFEDRAYYQKHLPANSHEDLATSLAVIPSFQDSQIFFGNTAELLVKSPHEERTGYLTVGIDADPLLQKLAFAIDRPALLVYEGRLFTAFGQGGEKIKATEDLSFPYAEMAKENSGIVSWHGENYFYVRVRPFPHVELDFFLLNLESKEFALLRDLDAGTKRVIDSIRLNTHIAGFIALLVAILLINNIARNITRPITQLANATKDVAEGNLEKGRLSLPPQKHKDEIAVLCHSFDEMVKGLQDREKVKGVLNKVVSHEIAQEILQGSIHLGGEEKKVTVLFADIRGFTSMTQAMPPKKVIELLNTCMTKISLSVDKNKGVIDKYVGDEAMALFGAPLSCGNDAMNAIRSALEMLDAMKSWNAERQVKGEAPIELGIGIHTGLMLVGNMGAENRLNYTVIGSNVNLASRVCSAAKKMEILITKDTLDQPFIKEHTLWEPLPPMQLKGFDRAIELFRVMGLQR